MKLIYTHAIKVKGQLIIIICTVILIILGVLWLIKNNNTLKEGNDTLAEGSETSKLITGVNDLLTNIQNTFDDAGKEINGGKKFTEIKTAGPTIANEMKALISSIGGDISDNIIINTDITTVKDTTSPPCNGKTFLNNKKFGDSLLENYGGNLQELNAKCSQLTSDNCIISNSCIWVNAETCMAGDVNGPFIKVDEKGNDIDYAYYNYKNECYGRCGADKTYANPCTVFGDGDKGVDIKCISRLWGQTKCPNTRYVTSDIVKSFKDYTKSLIKTIFSKAKDEKNYAKCYGPNEARWPAPCDAYPSDTNANISVRCLTKLYNDTGCDQTADVVTQEYANERRFSTKKDMIAKFAGYKAGENELGIKDSDYTKCFGEEESAWPEPCNNTTDTSTHLSKRCLTKIFDEIGCKTSDRYVTDDSVWQTRAINKKQFINYYKSMLTKTDDFSLEQCYGADKNTWPAVSMIIGIGMDYKIYTKRPSANTYIENAKWELEPTQVKQITMSCIIQLPNGWFYGTSPSGILFRKRYFGDSWEQDDVIGTKLRFSRVRMVYNMLIGVGIDTKNRDDDFIVNNNRLYNIDRSIGNPGVQFMGEDTYSVVDIAESPTGWPFTIIGGQDNRIRRRKYWNRGRAVPSGDFFTSTFGDGFGGAISNTLSGLQYINPYAAASVALGNELNTNSNQEGNDDSLDQRTQFNYTLLAIINIPTSFKEDNITPKNKKIKPLGLLTNGYLVVKKNIDEENWSYVSENNNIPMRNISYVTKRYGNVPEDSSDGYTTQSVKDSEGKQVQNIYY